MIAIIISFQLLQSLLISQLQVLCQAINILPHLSKQLFLGNTADTSIWLIHAYIRNIIKFTEDTQLRELSNTRHEHEAKLWLTILQRAIEIAHHITKHT